MADPASGSQAVPFDQRELSQALQLPEAEVGPWAVLSLGEVAAAAATQGLWRVRAADGRWSVILKVVHHSTAGHQHWLTSDVESDPMYWRREPLAYSSGLLDSLAGGLRAPRCLLACEREDGRVSLWLEDLDGLAGSAWPLERYGLTARHLGRMQGEFLADRPLPTEPWLSRGWLRAYVERRQEAMEVPAGGRERRCELARSLPPRLDEWSERTWSRRRQILDRLDRLPQTLCHFDFWPANLFAVRGSDGVDETVAIDWAYAGIGAIGEDVGNLVPDAMFDFFVPSAEGGRLLEIVYGGYLEGLDEGGWRGDERLVRYGLAASASVKYVWMLPWLLDRACDAEEVDRLAGGAGLTAEEFYARRREVLELLSELDEEADAIASTLPL